MTRPRLLTLPLLLLAFAGVARAQLVTITGTIQRADGSFPSGTATITNQQFVTSNGITVVAATKTITITSGVISTTLYPNVNSNPPGVSYTIVYSLSGSPAYQRNWYVPQGGPVTVTQIEFPPQGLVGTSAIVSPSQLTQAGAVLGECMSWNGSLWGAGTCGGSGSSAFNSITTGTNSSATMTVGTGASLTFTGLGSINANKIIGTSILGLSGNSGRLLNIFGTVTSGHLLSMDASGNALDSAVTAANVIVNTGSYANPSWITSLAGSKITGTLGCTQLPALTGDATTVAGSCVTTVVSTNGLPFAPSATIDATNASNISSGTLASARMSAVNLAATGNGGVTGNLQIANFNSGSGASSTTAWYGDGTWKPATGGTVTHTSGPLTAGAVVIGNSNNDVTVVPSLGTTTTLLHGNAGGSPSWGAVSLTADVSGLLGTANGGLNSASIAFSGPSGGAKTFALPNASATILTSNTPVTLAQGGTGQDLSAITKGGLIVGAALNTVAVKVVGTDGFVLVADSTAPGGVKWAVNSAGTGTVTSIATTTPITGGTITATGTIACPTCVTSAAALTANALVLGAGSQASAALGSLGTTTTVLHGNAAGAPSFAAVSLTADVSGALPVANGGTGWTVPVAHIAEVASYNFAAITPTGSPSISVGSNTVTIPTAPLGFSGTNTNYRVYISGGTGTAEAALVTGGTCTPGATACTLTFTAANTHSGAYTLKPANGGIQECVIANPRYTCHIAQDTYLIYYPAYIATEIKLVGDGPFSSYLQAQSATTGILDVNASHVVIEDLAFVATVQGSSSASYGIRLGNAGSIAFTQINRIYCEPLYDCVQGIHSTQEHINDSIFYNFSHAGIIADDPSSPDSVGPNIKGNTFFNYSLGSAAEAAIIVHSTSSLMIDSNVMIGGGANQLNYCIENDATTSGGWANVTSNKCEASLLAAFYFHGTWTQLTIASNTLGNTSGGGVTGWRAINLTGTGTMSRVAIGANVIQCASTSNDGIYFSGTYSNITAAGNQIEACNFGINANGTPSSTLIGPNNITGSLTSPVFIASLGVIIDSPTSFSFTQMTDTVGGIGNAGNASKIYCSNCNSTCTAGASTGRNCYRENSAWTH